MEVATMSHVRAPQLQPTRGWVNVHTPVSLRALRGHLVVLHFWSQSDLPIGTTVPFLNELRRRHRGDPFVVIGVHSGPGPHDADLQRVSNALEKRGMLYPVVADHDREIMSRYTVRECPAIVVISPDGFILGISYGDPSPAYLGQLVTDGLHEAQRKGLLATSLISIRPQRPAIEPGLRFPSSAAVARSGRVAISESGRHRVIVSDPEWHVHDVVGCGAPGRIDGPFETARFDTPHGVCWDGDLLWICDTANHCIRVADFRNRMVTTVAGTGAYAVDMSAGETFVGTTPLRFPWDICISGNEICFTDAGLHQVWRFDKSTHLGGPLAGTGTQGATDGSLSTATFAQPAGITEFNQLLYLTDNATNSIRMIDRRNGIVTTVAGHEEWITPRVDGALSTACFLGPRGIIHDRHKVLLVADSLNDALRVIDLQSAMVTTVELPLHDALMEPEGIEITPDNNVVIVDTNRHRLLYWDRAENVVTILRFSKLPLPVEHVTESDEILDRSADNPTDSFAITLTEPDVGETLAEGDTILSLTIVAPRGAQFVNDSPITVALSVTHQADLVDTDRQRYELVKLSNDDVVVPVRMMIHKLPDDEIEAEMQVQVTATVQDLSGQQQVKRCQFRVSLHLARKGGRSVGFNLVLPED